MGLFLVLGSIRASPDRVFAHFSRFVELVLLLSAVLGMPCYGESIARVGVDRKAIFVEIQKIHLTQTRSGAMCRIFVHAEC